MKNNKDEFNIDNALSFEASVKSLVEKSNKRAWLVTTISLILNFLLGLAIVFLTPLKTVEPFVIKVDKNGIVDIVSVLKEQDILAEEALDKYWISSYVKKREGYYFDLLQEDYNFVQLLSDTNVADDYRKVYDGANNRADTLKNKYEAKVKILSVTLNNSNGTKTATIRADINTVNLSSKADDIETKVFTISYDYFPKNYASEEHRLQNPLSFKVLTYRIDSEVK